MTTHLDVGDVVKAGLGYLNVLRDRVAAVRVLVRHWQPENFLAAAVLRHPQSFAIVTVALRLLFTYPELKSNADTVNAVLYVARRFGSVGSPFLMTPLLAYLGAVAREGAPQLTYAVLAQAVLRGCRSLTSSCLMTSARWEHKRQWLQVVLSASRRRAAPRASARMRRRSADKVADSEAVSEQSAAVVSPGSRRQRLASPDSDENGVQQDSDLVAGIAVVLRDARVSQWAVAEGDRAQRCLVRSPYAGYVTSFL